MNTIRSLVHAIKNARIVRDTRGLTSAEWLVIGLIIIGAASVAFMKVKPALEKKADAVAGALA